MRLHPSLPPCRQRAGTIAQWPAGWTEKTGAGNIGEQMFNQMMPTLKKMIPNASDQFWNNFAKQINSKTIINKTIPIYQKHLSQKEIDAINDFYDTPAGKKLIAAQPHISKASMEIGQAWGQKIAEDAIKQFKASRSK